MLSDNCVYFHRFAFIYININHLHIFVKAIKSIKKHENDVNVIPKVVPFILFYYLCNRKIRENVSTIFPENTQV
jgi:hypothetical protein